MSRAWTLTGFQNQPMRPITTGRRTTVSAGQEPSSPDGDTARSMSLYCADDANVPLEGQARAPGLAIRVPGSRSPGHRDVHWAVVPAGVVAVVCVLAFLPSRTLIPPLVQSDYCYMLLAADRLYDGLGVTSLQPVAPLQPWAWQYDWGFLTQWPIGYPLLVCAVRLAFGLPTLAACQWISIAACAIGFVGWLSWIKSCVPRGATGVLLAAVAAGCTQTVGLLINPSTDVVLIALMPFALSFAVRAVRYQADEGSEVGVPTGEPGAGVRGHPRRLGWLALSGLTAGGLFWIRYASIFVPLAIGVYLLIEWRFGGTRGSEDSPGLPTSRDVIPPAAGGGLALWQVAFFGGCAAAPVGALLLINSVFGTGSTQARLNLGHDIGFDFSPRLIARAWWNFTDFSFYDYHWFAHWIYAFWPAALLVGTCAIRPLRRMVGAFAATPGVCLSAVVSGTLLGMLIAATALFGDKYDYVSLERYYLPIRPLYFLLFVAPLALIPLRAVRVVLCIGLVIGCSWLVRQDWPRPYKRWLAANRATTPYGQWARCFEPGAADLYNWLRTQGGPDLIVVSNFHEYIALETGIPTLPIPKDVDTLTDWVERICASRGLTNPRVLFVLDPDNKGRDYWIPPPTTIVQTFALTVSPMRLPSVSAWVREYVPSDGDSHTAANPVSPTSEWVVD